MMIHSLIRTLQAKPSWKCDSMQLGRRLASRRMGTLSSGALPSLTTVQLPSAVARVDWAPQRAVLRRATIKPDGDSLRASRGDTALGLSIIPPIHAQAPS